MILSLLYLRPPLLTKKKIYQINFFHYVKNYQSLLATVVKANDQILVGRAY